MKLRSVLLVSVGVGLLAAGAAVAGTAGTKKPSEVTLTETAYQALVAGRPAAAIASYTEAIESRKLPVDLLANSLLNRALAYQRIGEHQAAVDDYSAAMRMDAMSPRLRAVALYNRGLSHHKLDQPALAIEDFTSALLLDPEFAEAYLSRANALRLSGQYLFALGDYEKALRYSYPDPHVPLYGQALTYEALDRPLLAQKALARAIKVSPDFAPARDKLIELGGEEAVAKAEADDELPQPQQASLPLEPDEFVTGSLGAGPDLVMRKPDLPEPVRPPEAMVGEEEAAVAKDEPPQPAEVAAAEEQAEAEPEPTPEPASAPAMLEGWMVQLTSQRKEEAAWSVWEKLSERHAKLLGGRDAAVVRADLGTKGVYYRLRIHRLESRDEAQRLCSRLKAVGAACYVGRADS